MNKLLTLESIEALIIQSAAGILKTSEEEVRANAMSTLKDVGLTSIDVVDLIVEMERALGLDEVPDAMTEDDPSLNELSKRLFAYASKRFAE